ncbi:protein turtle-like isoform X2 [Argiope bruennichi]|uniref:protein turtle-like isoform X2 n=1 Tax=Argiope bruennichi TaxID=94029 RepID=UPI0024946F52|nr:protein turtle-like isoform X2 [Argiope bruennichi]
MVMKKTCHFIVFISVCSFAVYSGITQSEPEYTTALLGEDVILPCTFSFPEGTPVPYVVQWQKQDVKIPIYIWYDGYPPHAGEGYEGRASLAGLAALNLTSVREADQGWYECKVYFLNRPPDSPKNGSWVHLDVLAPPHFKLKPPDTVYVKVGESVTLNCEAIGTPLPVISWTKDNLPLQASPSIQITASELRINNIQQSDIGDYLCVASNKEGKVSALTKVIVAGPAVITVPPRNTSKLEGGKVEFICEAKALPANITHRWYHNGVDITQLSWLESRSLIRKDGLLFINPLTAEDSGLYTCEVSNGIGNPDSASAYLSVEYPARVTYSPTIQYLPAGLSGILRCYVQANPPFQFINWTKDRRPFDPNANPGVITLNNGSLLFQRVSHEHQGRYRCTPYNVHGTAGTSNIMEVLVRDPPMFIVKPHDTYQKPVNSEVKMPCVGSGQPKPTVVWRRADGEKLPRERAIIRGGNLTIKGLRKEDHGRYECVLENEIATLVTSTLLLVEGTTPHAPTNVTVNTSSFDATLTWLPAYDGNYEQTYVIWYRLADQGISEWRTVRVVPEGSTTVTLYNLQPDTEYEFQVLSRNILGDGLFSPIVKARTKTWDYLGGVYPTDAYGATYIPTVQKPSGPKPWPPRNVTVIKGALGVIISWQPPKNQTVPVAFYFVESRTDDGQWQRWGPIRDETSYLMSTLTGGQTYHFRVYAYSIMSVGSASPEVIFHAADDESHGRNKAITAGVVGGVLFFIVAIILSICAVKICNKRKRRKAEKAYKMVTCSVTDQRNGGHSHTGSPLPIKKNEESGIPSIKFPSLASLGRIGIASNPKERTRTFHGWPVHLRHPRGARYNVQMEYSQPLGWISRSADGKFVLRGSADDEEGGFVRTAPTAAHSLIPSNYAGARGSIRSDGSGQSSHHLHLSPSTPLYGPYATPSRFHTSSPGLGASSFFAEDISSVRQPSSVERSFPSTVSSHLTPPFPMHFRPIHRAQDAPPPNWMLHQQVLGSPLQTSYQQGWPGSRHWLPAQAYPATPAGPRFYPVRPSVPRGFSGSIHPRQQISPTHHRPLATSSPPHLEGHGVSQVPCGNDSSESGSSDVQPVTYTRDRLLGAVERVRSAAYHRQLHAPGMEFFSEMDGPLVNNRRLTTPSRTSVTSGSSGHGSKAASLAHSSLQGELDVNNRSGSSSGFVSRNHSAAFHSASLTPNGVPHHNGGSSVFEADSPHSEPALPIVDGYIRPRNRPSGAARYMRDGWSERGLSDSELCGGLYPTGPRKYENTEARCAALKEEFLRFRQRQRERQRSVELESTC